MNDAPKPIAATRPPEAGYGGFRPVEAWVFDLDNTLYPQSAGYWNVVNDRIRSYVEKALGLAAAEATAIQKKYYRDYGTTLRGLMLEHRIDPDDYLAAVHDIDHHLILPAPALAEALARLPGRKFIMTNASLAHAEKVAARLGVTGQFHDIFDIRAAEFVPKPTAETYNRFIARTGVAPARAAMFEDLARNLEVPHRLGMRTTLVVPSGARPNYLESWETEGHAAPHVEYVTDDLAGFVGAVAGAVAKV